MTKIEKYYDALKRFYLIKGNGFYDGDFPYNKEHPYYFKEFILRNTIMDTPKYILNEIKDSQCNALVSKNGNPPEMLCVASSARQCLSALGIFKGNDMDIEHLKTFLNEGDEIDSKVKPHFEKKLRIKNIVGYCPNMDAYFESKNEEYFFECKCGELFSNEKKNISKQYFQNKKHLLGPYLKENIDYIIKNDKYYLNKDKVGSFDLNQFVKHLMGIISNKKKEVVNLNYYYFIPEDQYLDIMPKNYQFIKETLKNAKEDCINAFNLDYIRKMCKDYKINLRLFIGDAVVVHPASEHNTHLFYKKDWNE